MTITSGRQNLKGLQPHIRLIDSAEMKSLNQKGYEMNIFQKINPIFAAVTLVWFTAGCNNQPSADQNIKPIPVETADVIQESVSFPVRTSGVLVSSAEIKLSFKTGGIIGQIQVSEGDRVKEGQLLASLDQAEIKARVQTAESAFEKAERDFRRVSDLYADSVATLEQKQDAETALKVAEANLEIARYNLRHSSITAPSDGKILKQLAEVNEMVESGHPVLIFGSTENAYRIRAGVTDRDIIRLRHGDSAMASFEAFPGEKFPASVTEISQAADPFTGTYEVELSLRDTRHRLVFGLVGNIQIFPSEHKKVYRIPVESLVEADGPQGTVYVINPQDGTAQRTQVEIAEILKNDIAVSSGLEGIEKVITKGSPYLSDGAAIRIIR